MEMHQIIKVNPWVIVGALLIPVGMFAGRAYYKNMADRIGAEEGLPSGLLAAVARAESNYNPFARSHAGALGIMQIIPRWHPGVNPWRPSEAMRYAARYLKQLREQFGNYTLALAAYNWGPGNLSRKGWLAAPEETKTYVQRVLEFQQQGVTTA